MSKRDIMRLNTVLFLAFASGLIFGCGYDVNTLIEDLKHKDSWSERCKAANQLGASKDPRAIKPLSDALKNDVTWAVRENAARAMGQVVKDPKDAQPLVEALSDKSEKVRSAAAEALVKLQSPGIADLLILELTNETSRGRSSAAWLLGRIRSPKAVVSLIQCLGDKDDSLVEPASGALSLIGDPRAIKPLESISAAKALCHLGSAHHHKEALESLSRLLEACQGRKYIADCLVNAGWVPETDEQKIHLWAAQEDYVKLKAFEDVAERVLQTSIESTDACRVKEASYTLIKMGARRSIPRLVDALNRFGDRSMAEAYLNCGLEELQEAARGWGRQRGFSVEIRTGTPYLKWGQTR